MNRSERLVGLLAARRPEPSDDRSAQRRRCPRRSRGLRGGVDRPDVSQRVAAPVGLRRRGAGLLRRPPRLPLRLHGVDGPDDQGVRRRHPRLRRRPRSGVGVASPRASARTTSPSEFLARFTDDGGGAVRRPGPGEGRGVAHPAPLQPGDRGQLRLAGPLHGVHQLLLLLLRGRRLRPVLPQVQHLLPLHRQAVHQRQRVGQAPGREGRDRVHRRWTTGSPPCDDVPAVQAICDSLGPEHIDALLRKWLADPAQPVHRPRTRPPATATSCRSCRRSSP